MTGRWRDIGTNLPAKFLIVGSVLYLLGCFQGSVEALRSLQQPTHFTDFVVGHSHITVFGTFVMWAIAGVVYVWPRITLSTPATFRLANAGFWLITLGIASMVLVLTAQGLQQGFMLMAQAEWVDSMTAIRPYWWLRSLTGVVMDIGISLVVLTLVRGSAVRAA
jgi:cytochrome c oxidase cbb3-type subunit 1